MLDMPKISEQNNEEISSLQLNNEHATSMYTFLTVKEVSKVLKVSRDTIYRLLNDRKLAFYHIAGSKRIALEDMKNYITKCAVEAQHENEYGSTKD